MMINCRECVWFEQFDKRPYEITNMGCKHADWGGYIIDPAEPECSGFGFWKKDGKDTDEIHSNKS